MTSEASQQERRPQARPSAARLAFLESLRQPTVAEIEERLFLREQVAWVERGGPEMKDPPRVLLPLPND